MTAHVRTVGRRDTVRAAANIMRDRHIQHLVVVDIAGRVCGVLSDRDVRNASPSSVEHDADHHDPLAKLRVEQLMSPNPVTIHETDDVAKALEQMLSHKIGCVAVVDELGGAVGILTGFDVVKLALQMLEALRSLPSELG